MSLTELAALAANARTEAKQRDAADAENRRQADNAAYEKRKADALTNARTFIAETFGAEAADLIVWTDYREDGLGTAVARLGTDAYGAEYTLAYTPAAATKLVMRETCPGCGSFTENAVPTLASLAEPLAVLRDCNTRPLDDRQRLAVDRYHEKVAPLRDSLDSVSSDGFADLATDLGRPPVEAIIRKHFGVFGPWWLALDGLYADLAHGPAQQHTKAARAAVEREANDYFHHLNLLRREACAWAFGTAGPQPGLDAGVLTFDDIPPRIHLNGTALAEASN